MGENLLQDIAFDFDGAAPLGVAARAGLIDEVAALLAAGADVNESIADGFAIPLLVPLCAAAVPNETNIPQNLYFIERAGVADARSPSTQIHSTLLEYTSGGAVGMRGAIEDRRQLVGGSPTENSQI